MIPNIDVGILFCDEAFFNKWAHITTKRLELIYKKIRQRKTLKKTYLSQLCACVTIGFVWESVRDIQSQIQNEQQYQEFMLHEYMPSYIFGVVDCFAQLLGINVNNSMIILIQVMMELYGTQYYQNRFDFVVRYQAQPIISDYINEGGKDAYSYYNNGEITNRNLLSYMNNYLQLINDKINN